MTYRTAFALALASLLVPSVAPAAPGDAPPGGGSSGGSGVPELRRIERGAPGQTVSPERLPGDSIRLEGRVVDGSGSPVAKVAVKLFADGALVGSTTTSPDGLFVLAANPMQSGKGSAVMWFQSPDPEIYLDASVVLWAADSARQHGLFPPCTQFVQSTQGIATVEVTMRSLDERKTAVVASKCLEGA